MSEYVDPISKAKRVLADKKNVKFRVSNLTVEPAEYFTFDTKEELFEKMIELNSLDKFGVVRFRMNSHPFLGDVHLFPHSVVSKDDRGLECKRIFYSQETACHKDGFHERFLVDY